MKFRSFLIAAIILSATFAQAQILTGTVIEAGRNTRLENVFVREVGSKQVGLTDKSGEFSIRTSANHTLIFSLPGYVSDTLFVTDLKPKHIELQQAGISLQAVNVSETKGDFNPEAEYPEIYEKSKFALSPSRIFGKESRDARRLKHYFKNEVDQRKIDAVFTRTLVSSVVPLKGRDLDNFMGMYRPSLSFAQNSSHQTMVVYINDCYKKYKLLPPDQRGLPPLQ